MSAAPSKRTKRKPAEQSELEQGRKSQKQRKGKHRRITEEQRFWFQLVDAVTGQPFKDTGVTYVSSKSSMFVAQFLENVKDKDRTDASLLTDIAATQLRVYKNQASFEKRNASEEAGKEEPLKSSSLLEGLGSSEEEALIVPVPQGILFFLNKCDLMFIF
jgi:hypothetical protein